MRDRLTSFGLPVSQETPGTRARERSGGDNLTNTLAIVKITLCLLLLIGLFWPWAAQATEEASFQPADQAAALAARIAGDEVRTRIVIDLAGEVAPSVYLLPEPNRLILDLPGLSFEPMDDADVEPRGLISAFRYGPFAPGRGRIVVDLSDYVVIDEILMLAALDDQPARLVLDLVRSDEDGFMAEVERTRESFLASVEAPKENRLDIANTSGRPIIVVDPGHGGIDSGAVSRSGVLEKEVVLRFAREFVADLRATGRFEVYDPR